MTDLDELVAIARALGPDERRVLTLIARRLALGRTQYGSFDLCVDRRNFLEEALHEAADLAVYLAAEQLRSQLRR